jgi:pimeloyl-ACP methyl ester carboxylesterase
VVLYVHASGSSGRQWKRWTEALPGLTPDLLGSGANPPWEGPFALQQDVDHLVAIAAPHAPVDLVGHSYGGSLALFLTLQRPDLVRRVVVYEPPLMGLLATGSAEDRALLDTLPPGFADPAVAGTEPWLATFVDWWNGPGAWAALAEPVRAEFQRVGPKVAGEVLGLRRDPRTMEDYAKLSRPTLILKGDRTPEPVAVALRKLGRLPNARLVEVADAGHMAPVVAPDRLIPAVAAFLG